ncbi:hypothetical protein [Microbacterium terregens]|uniref:Gram-positive cocci surface proteins LPxTG domain-containing protein n=1 Tax=Microbacterium terregens TaxID=69363 RepID=A0ABV5T1T1_9MICO
MSVLSIVATSGSLLAATLLAMTGSPAAAEEAPPPPPIELVLHVPAGMSVDVLREPGDHGSVSVAGCPADGAILFASTLLSPTGDGGVVEVPIGLEVVAAADGAAVQVPLEPISVWLVANNPGPLASVLLEAACVQQGEETAWATAVLPSGVPPLPAIPPTTPDAPVPGPDPDAATVPAASESSTAGPRRLAASGASAPGASLIVGSVLLLLGGGAAVVMARRRAV